MLIATLTTITVCLHIHSTVAITDYITNYQSITISSVLKYNNHSYDPGNVVDKNPGTLPDDCECCWSTNAESNPTITLLLQHPTVIGFIEILGRTDGNAGQRLSGINILIDGQNRNTYQHYDSSNNNKVTVQMPPERARNITINRPKPSGVWILTICEIKAYRSVNIADRASITVSSTSTYGGYDYKSENVLDGSNQTTPDTCGCCWSSQNETTPKLSLQLIESSPVVFLEIIGRSDRLHNAPRNLYGTSIIVDGADKSHDQIMEGNNVYLALPPSTPVRNITVLRQGPTGTNEWYLIICEIKVFSLDLNIFAGDRQHRLVSQSSIFNNDTTSYGPQNAIDGKDIYAINTCGCCSVTNKPNPSWWQIDLGQQYLIQGIQIYGRASDANEQLQNAVVYAGNKTLTQNQQDGANIYTVPTMNGTTRHFTKMLDEATVSQYFLVKLNKDILTLCEFKLLQEVCDVDRFGFGCSHICHCFDNKTCNSASGECKTARCYAGWNGTACDQECASPAFGSNCNDICHCINETYCDHVTGHCDKGACDPACTKGNYGMNCLGICSDHCKGGGNNCDTVTGACISGCMAGYTGDKCDHACNKGNYGVNCANNCSEHCIGGINNCDTFTGACTSGCTAGYTGDKCDQDCPVDHYGLNCSHHCYLQCKNTLCDKISGTCSIGCVDGYLGDYCNNTCSEGKYGQNCSQTCGSCLNHTTCKFTNGFCENGCEPGYNGTRCSPCPVGYYGDGCGNRCHCIDGVDCLKNNGSCPDSCEFGWSGDNCSIDMNIFAGDKQNMSVKQSSIYMSNRTLFGPQNAIDRKDNYDIDTCGCCSVTDNTGQWSWWQIDLGQQYLIHGIQIYGRSSGEERQLQDAIIYAGNTSLVQTQQYGMEIYTVPRMNATTRNFTKILDEATISQYFLVKLNQRVLTLCEFKLFEEVCDVGGFGVGCNHNCHCSDKKTCYTVTGECQTSGCDIGWNGTACDQECESPTFGNNCLEICNCFNGTHCDHMTGHCDEEQCDPGWQGESCSQECESRNFGNGCNKTCHCFNGTHCDHVTGHCDEGQCDPGWLGKSCSQECVSPKFGNSCNKTCHCFNGTHCNHVTGYCDEGQCDPGWLGKSCSQALEPESASQENTDNTSAVALVAGSVAAAILVIVVVVVVFVVYKRKKGFGKQTERGNNGFSDISKPALGVKPEKQQSSQGNINHSFEAETKFESGGGDYYSFGPSIGIKRHQLWTYIRDKMQNKCEEFYKEFTKVPYGLVHLCKDAKHPNNMGKNRYRDMYAYDHSRVKLVVNEPGEVDYINACYINGFDKVKKFVAAQGPWKNMVDDFWRLAWQINTDKIVMLTNLVELGTTKCLQYWPDEGELCYGKVCVKLVRTESYLDYDVRHLSVSKEGESTRKIKQFHFKSWPDKDVPDSTWCLVNYWRAVDTNEATGAGPILVHCSAGVGRTGTFIALDNLVSQCKSEGSMRPLQIVQSLRDQRVNMVQTKEQYVYLHEAVADALFIGTHYIWTKQFEEVYQFLLQSEKGETESRLEFQFNLIERGIEETTPDNDNAEYSNVETLVTEGDAHRPRSQRTGAVIAPQLGAIYMPNYNGKNTFILTQSPANSTMEEFLTLIGEHNIRTVLMLTDTSSPSYKDICQLHIPNFDSRLIEEKTGDNVIEQTFSYKRTHQGDEKLSTIKQFRYTAWKENRQVPDDTATFIEFLEAVLRWQSHASESQPILIHCGDDQNRSGLTYAVLNELFRINMDGHVNIVETVTKMKQRRRQMIAGYEQYQYCCKFLLAYIKHTQIYSNL